MARKRRGRRPNGLPWYSRSRDCWVTPRDPKKTALRDRAGVIRGDTPAAESRAVRAWHAAGGAPAAVAPSGPLTVDALLNVYLDDLEPRASPDVYASYARHFGSFSARWPGLLVSALTPDHVRTWWADKHPNWGPSTRRLSGAAVKAAVRWASLPGKSGGLIPADPLAGMPLPAVRKRAAAVVLTDAEFGRLLAACSSDPLRDVLAVCWHTGTRTVNLFRATAANVVATPGGGAALLFAGHNTPPGSAVHKTFRRTGRPLVVPLPPAARAVVERLAAARPTGPLFRTPTGLPWTNSRLPKEVLRAAKKAGLAGRAMAYACRHTKATALLESGLSLSDVAAILGNTPAVVAATYSHVGANTDRLLDLIAGSGRGGLSPPGAGPAPAAPAEAAGPAVPPSPPPPGTAVPTPTEPPGGRRRASPPKAGRTSPSTPRSG